ncbi:hypothetical protein BU23DRAFT_473814, partial [Bimuria novae-zelandiae CBS 107.79]
EFDDDEHDDTATSVTNYVEATIGANWELHFQFSSKFHAKHDLSARLYVDGRHVVSFLLYAKDIKNGTSQRYTGMREKTSSGCFLRKFVFSDLHTGMLNCPRKRC